MPVNVEDEACLDVSARGFRGFEHKKKQHYEHRVRVVEMGSFTPFIF